MSAPEATRVDVFVDPSCPFAWITEQWLVEVERHRPIELGVHLLSLSVVNEGRDIDEWYRSFNDAGWVPARVMAAVELDSGPAATRRFYEEYGKQFHVELETSDDADRLAMSLTALERAGLPAALGDGAKHEDLDDTLRTWTLEALAPVGLDVGVPVVLIEGVASSGPVLSKIPRGDDAVALFDAVVTLARQPGFVRIVRQQLGGLDRT